MTDPTQDPPGRRNAFIALLVIAALLVGGFWLQRHIRANDSVEDCMLAGRKNCAPATP